MHITPSKRAASRNLAEVCERLEASMLQSIVKRNRRQSRRLSILLRRAA